MDCTLALLKKDSPVLDVGGLGLRMVAEDNRGEGDFQLVISHRKLRGESKRKKHDNRIRANREEHGEIRVLLDYRVWI